MLASKVSWRGLSEMIRDIKRRQLVEWPKGANAMTKKAMNTIHATYVQNLSGAVPSTAVKPLPVGVRSGNLKAGAKKRQVNQYRCYVENLVPYSGFIENGTYKMAPRRPLADAVEKFEAGLQIEAEKVLVEVWEK